MRTKNPYSKLTELSSSQEGFIKSFDGTQLHYRAQGQGTPLVFCNGLGCSTFYFDYQVSYFKRDYQAITWDYRGHGQSEAPKVRKNHSIQSLVRDLKTLLDKLKIDQAILIGHSMGTQVVYEFYKQHPEKVKGIISCFGTFGKPMDTFYNTPLSKYVFEVIYIFNHLFPKAANMIGTLMVKNPLWFQMGGLFKMMKPSLADKGILRKYIDHIINVDPIFLSNLTRSLQEHTTEHSLQDVRVPTLIFGAEEDTFTPLWISKKMHHLIPHSELFIVKKGSHVALVEQPELINLRMEKFFKEHFRKPAKKKKK